MPCWPSRWRQPTAGALWSDFEPCMQLVLGCAAVRVLRRSCSPPPARLPLSCSPLTRVWMCLPCRLWGTVREEGSLRGNKGKEVAPLGGANITGAPAAGAGLRR